MNWTALVPQPVPFARQLQTDGLILFGAGVAMQVVFFLLMVRGRLAGRIQEFISRRVRLAKARTPLTLTAYLVLYEILMAPVSFADYLVLHHFGLAVQSPARWAADLGKGFMVELIVLVPCLLLLGWAMRRWPRGWWVAAGVCFGLAGALMIYVTPVVVDPLFHTFRPLQAGALRTDILQLTSRAHIHVNGVYVAGFSATTTEGNAYVTGLGSSKRVVIWDTLLKSYTPDEMQSIVAHELGHYALHHILIGLLLTTLGTFLLLFFGSLLIRRGVKQGWIRKPGDPESLIPLAALMVAANLVGMPVTNAISRTIESQADHFSLELTRRPDWFIQSMQHLSRQDASVPFPDPAIEVVFYTHPSISERIHSAVEFATAEKIPMDYEALARDARRQGG